MSSARLEGLSLRSGPGAQCRARCRRERHVERHRPLWSEPGAGSSALTKLTKPSRGCVQPSRRARAETARSRVARRAKRVPRRSAGGPSAPATMHAPAPRLERAEAPHGVLQARLQVGARRRRPCAPNAKRPTRPLATPRRRPQRRRQRWPHPPVARASLWADDTVRPRPRHHPSCRRIPCSHRVRRRAPR